MWIKISCLHSAAVRKDPVLFLVWLHGQEGSCPGLGAPGAATSRKGKSTTCLACSTDRREIFPAWAQIRLEAFATSMANEPGERPCELRSDAQNVTIVFARDATAATPRAAPVTTSSKLTSSTSVSLCTSGCGSLTGASCFWAGTFWTGTRSMRKLTPSHCHSNGWLVSGSAPAVGLCITRRVPPQTTAHVWLSTWDQPSPRSLPFWKRLPMHWTSGVEVQAPKVPSTVRWVCCRRSASLTQPMPVQLRRSIPNSFGAVIQAVLPKRPPSKTRKKSKKAISTVFCLVSLNKMNWNGLEQKTSNKKCLNLRVSVKPL